MNVVFFKTAAGFRRWLELYYNTEKEIWVGYYKTSTQKDSITWPQSVDEAICFGWIDGIRKSVDAESYCIRFTPRNARSNWSGVNIKKAEVLIAKGLMQPSGLKLFEQRKEDKSEVYSYENKPEILPDELEQTFKSNKEAWMFFMKQALSYRKTIFYWIMSAKQEATRNKRLEKLIEACEAGKKLF
jgi:uncharacterized protein YdeI (YjbR/CyaY-like superfamily)